MKRAFAIVILAAPLCLVPSCDQPSRICDLICECEHCNDIVEEYRCDSLDASQEIADIYECDSEWESYANCVEDKGECDEEEARFSTREPGRCGSTSDTGIPCTADSDCAGMGAGNASCGPDMTCVYPSCSGDSGQPCTDDSECSGGEDRCENEMEELAECIAEASDDPRYVEIDFD